MSNDFTKKFKVFGMLYLGNHEYYVVGWKKLVDELGSELSNFGWLVTSTIPLNMDMVPDEEVTPIYNSPVLAIGGGFIASLAELPKEIELLNNDYVDTEDGELWVPKTMLMDLPTKMSEDEWNELLTRFDNMKIGD